jgi:hypothetical protein
VAFGVLETAGGVAEQTGQRVIRFLGDDRWIAVVRDVVYRTNDGGATYSSVVTDGDLGANTAKAGPYLLYPGGVATLVIAARSGTNVWRLFTSTDGSSWAKSGSFALYDPANFPPWSVTEWRGSLYAFVNSGSAPNTLIWNTTNMSFVVGPCLDQGSSHAMAVYQDRLFAVGVQNSVNTGRSLYEFLAGAWVEVDIAFLSGATGIGSSLGSRFALFVDPASDLLVGIILGASGVGGWRAYSWNSALTRTEITSAISIQSVLGSATTSSRIAEIVDRQDNLPTTEPTIYLYVAVDGATGTPNSLYQWNGIASAFTSLGSGGNTRHALPLGVHNGGSAFWTSGQRHIERISATPVIGGVRYGFKIYSPNPTVDAVSVRWIRTNAVGEYPATPYATLSNPSVGTLGAGNTQIDGLDAADNGVTTFFVTWLAQTDGFSIGAFAKTTPQIFS